MRFVELVEILQKKYNIYSCITNGSSKAKDIKLLDYNNVKWNENTIYVGDFTKLINKNRPDKPIMAFNTNDKDVSNLLPKGSSYCYICNNELLGLFNEAKDLLYENLRIQADLFEIFEAVLDGKNIINIINIAANLLGNDLILTDSDIKVLVYSTIYETVELPWIDDEKERHHQLYELIHKIRSDRKLNNWREQDNRTEIISLSGNMQSKLLVSRIIKNGHPIGALIMIANNIQINDYHIRQLPIIANVLLNVINNDGSNRINKSFYSNILYNLLNEKNAAEIFELMNMSQADFPRKMYVVVACIACHMENRYFKRTIITELEHIFLEGHLVQYKNYIGILVPSISAKQRKRLDQLAQNENINIGLSWPFTDIMQFRRYFYQAVISIKQAQYFNETKQVFDYTDLSYYDLLWNYNGRIPLKYYCHPALEILRNYDDSNNTELYITLRTYLECNKNLSKTSRKLFIHRNSLIYRINRINELTQLDLDNINVLYSLIDSFRIEKFINSTTNK